MDIYVTDLATGDRLRFPMLPQKINVQTGSIFQSYTILAVGDVRLPTGQELTGFSWQGTLPGEVRKNAPFVAEWRSPKEIQSLWSAWRAGKKKLRLMATETPINHDVYLERYTMEYSGGQGDYSYNISFVQAKDLKVYVSGASGQSSSTAATVENKPQGDERPSTPVAAAYTVKKGDTLWGIAQKFLGNGAKYQEIYNLNKSVIGNNPNLIYPGQVLTIPS
ncbi:MAG: LysM peptidoglycan-binding domain-containing protein [Clostridium sp.]|jgi:LysM repeat protein|nr:LysM peptidoglycan-binding domain-containing protein [Clostridium sp.]